MTERDYAKKLTSELDRGLQQINGVTLQRLADTRRQALARAHALDREWVMSQHNSGGEMVMGGGGHGDDHHLPAWMRPMSMGLLLLALLTGVVLWQHIRSDSETNELGYLDAQMLSGELPPSTYIHPEFKEWLNDSKDAR
jgi:hypothetical protein